MRASTGTIPQLYRATGVPVRTLQRWARQGKLTRVGTHHPARYDAHQVMRVRARKTRRVAA